MCVSCAPDPCGVSKSILPPWVGSNKSASFYFSSPPSVTTLPIGKPLKKNSYPLPGRRFLACLPFCTLILARPGGLAALAFKCGMPSTPTILEVLEPPPAACESAAAHAARRCLPRIVTANAASYPPPSLNNFRTAAARAPADSAPALWYWQLTGEEWQRDGHSYELAKKAWRRMPAEHKAAERERDRSGRKRPADDGAKAAQRSRVKREAETLEATAAYRVVDTHAFISADGHVHLLVAPSEVRASRLEPETPCVPYLYSISVRSLATAGHLPRPRVLPSS